MSASHFNRFNKFRDVITRMDYRNYNLVNLTGTCNNDCMARSNNMWIEATDQLTEFDADKHTKDDSDELLTLRRHKTYGYLSGAPESIQTMDIYKNKNILDFFSVGINYAFQDCSISYHINENLEQRTVSKIVTHNKIDGFQEFVLEKN